MTIPELMYGSWRYDVRGYTGDDFIHCRVGAAKGSRMSTTFAALAIRNPAWSIVWSLLLIIFGLLTIGLPLATSLGVVLIIGWLLVLSGAVEIFRIFYASQSLGIVRVAWVFVVALLYSGMGVYLFVHPLLGASSMALAIGFFFTAEAIIDFVGYLAARKSPGAGWILFDGIGTLILGLLIWKQWTLSSAWAIGTLVGISMLMTGITRLMTTVASHNYGEARMEQ
jgi:uncharacterized membrane protein HdeD (DUF308 family)